MKFVRQTQEKLLTRILFLEQHVNPPSGGDDALEDDIFHHGDCADSGQTFCDQEIPASLPMAQQFSQTMQNMQQTAPICVPTKGSRRGSQTLDSSSIAKHTLAPPDHIASCNPKLVKASKAPTFAVKLAKESFFGEDVLRCCTVNGCREYPGLPVAELQELKQYLFTRLTVYWSNPTEFETVWSDCVGAIGQACARERRKTTLMKS